jgi:Glycosyltransferase family 87
MRDALPEASCAKLPSGGDAGDSATPLAENATGSNGDTDDPAMQERMSRSSSHLVRLGCLLVILALWLTPLVVLDFDHGVARAVIVCGLVGGLGFVRLRSFPAFGNVDPSTFPKWLRVVLILGIVLDVSIAFDSVASSVRTRQILLDQGHTTWIAARLVWRGENPYGAGAVVDSVAFDHRSAARRDVGIVANVPDRAALEAEFQRYFDTLDPTLRQELLPLPENNKLSGAAAREVRLAGYKYGPVLVLLTAPFVLLDVPAVVPLLNSIACFALFAVLWRIFSGIAGDWRGLAALGLSILLFDRQIEWNYIHFTATDVWPLLFAALAVLAFRSNRQSATAAALAFAVGCKIFPSLLFIPLLLSFRSYRPIVVFTVITGAIYLPWLIWDPAGVAYNIFLWPLLADKDTTSWLYYAPPMAAYLARAILFVLMGICWLRFLIRRETRLFWTLAVVNTLVLLAGGQFHNNYVPWASIWIVAAILEAFSENMVPLMDSWKPVTAASR